MQILDVKEQDNCWMILLNGCYWVCVIVNVNKMKVNLIFKKNNLKKMFTSSSQWEQHNQKNRQPIDKPIFVNCENIDQKEFANRFYCGFPNCEGWVVMSVLGPHNTCPSVPGWCVNVLKAFSKDQHEHAQIFAKEASNYLNIDLYVVQTGKFAPLPPPKGLPTSYADSVMDQHVNGYVNRENSDRRKLIDTAMKTSEENKQKIVDSEKRQAFYLEKSSVEKDSDRNFSERIDQPVKRSAFFDQSEAEESTTTKDIDM